MNDSLYETIEEAQHGDKEKLEIMINRFMRMINKFSRKLTYEEAKTDLIICFIETIQTLDLKKFDLYNEGAVVKYIHTIMKNKHIDLFRKYVQGRKETLEMNVEIEADKDTFTAEEKIFIEDLFNKLTNTQKMVLKARFIEGYSDAEIAQKMHITRQAVNKTKKRALNNLRKYLGVNLLGA
jgi:RNA polymerase sigma factor (sigma-70 family)